MKRYNDSMLGTENTTVCKNTEKTRNKLATADKNSYDCSANYANPPIPPGFSYVRGKWYNGFVIKSNDTENYFTWVPVGFLKANGTLDGKHFSEKFGRRNYMNDEFSDDGFHEQLDKVLLAQSESVNKYGGYYISSYNISFNGDWPKSELSEEEYAEIRDRYRSHFGVFGNRRPRGTLGMFSSYLPPYLHSIPTCQLYSRPGADPMSNIKYFNVIKESASKMIEKPGVSSHLLFGAEYDSVVEWFLETGVITWSDMLNGSENLGNFWNTKNSQKKRQATGARKEWRHNNIYDLIGNVREVTQEKCRKSVVIRGGSAYDDFDGPYYIGTRDSHRFNNFQVEQYNQKLSECLNKPRTMPRVKLAIENHSPFRTTPEERRARKKERKREEHRIQREKKEQRRKQNEQMEPEEILAQKEKSRQSRLKDYRCCGFRVALCIE